MKNCLTLFLVTLFSMCSSQQEETLMLEGNWKAINNYSLPISALTQEEVKNIMLQYISLRRNGIKIFTQNECRENFEHFPIEKNILERINMDEYSYSNKTYKENIGIKSDTANVFTFKNDNCTLEIICTEKGNILIPYKGVFFEYQKE